MTVFVLISSVVIGVIMVLAFKPSTKIIQLLLAFSGAYLLSITVLHLLPEVFKSNKEGIGIYILIGILLQTILEYFSKGAEHGHIHTHSHSKVSSIPWLLLLSLNLHAFFEGIPLRDVHNKLLLWAIVIHKVPVSIVLFIFFISSNISKKYSYLLMAVFAIMSPLGYLISNDELYYQYNTEITAIIIGIFLHIATAILFESSQNHQFNIRKFIAVLTGFAVAFLSTQLLHFH
ncbi:MAG: ZIP family metal transporter [Flavobacteriaceae bacterium]|jgi:zinc transporter ZupT|nr:ZIP family metal transporter [Flavobacteriaceae bacterium]MCB0485937.1 ZIP family metal transporter [Flavobacteriaceae bacterium]